jgi:hypothetical protein
MAIDLELDQALDCKIQKSRVKVDIFLGAWTTIGAQVTQIAPKIWVVAGAAGEGGHLRFALRRGARKLEGGRGGIDQWSSSAPTLVSDLEIQSARYINLEDDFEETVEVRRPKTKVLHSKEIFPVLRDDEFAELHNPQCDTCKAIGHAKERGGSESRST